MKLAVRDYSLSVSVLNSTLALGRNLGNHQVLALEDVNSFENYGVSYGDCRFFGALEGTLWNNNQVHGEL